MVREIQISTETKPVDSLIEYAKQHSEGLDVEIKELTGVYNIFDLIQTCSARTKYNPDWGILAGRMMMKEIRKTAGETFSKSTELLKEQLHPDYYDFVMQNADVLDGIVDESNSDNRQCISVATCLKSYLVRYKRSKDDETDELWAGETIEQMYLRVATFLCMPDIQMIRKVYTSQSFGRHSHATPTLFNAGLKRHQMASCFIGVVPDSLWGIENYWVAMGDISRNAGGIGCDFSQIRHSLIGSVGKSGGIPALLPTYEKLMQYVDQSKKRKGSLAVYTAIWHIDIETVIKMKDPHGAESDETKCLDLSYAVWLNDLFMERVNNKEKWSLFCPKKAPGLTEVWGDEFRELYTRYEQEGRAFKVVGARDLLLEIIQAQTRTGMPYISNADAFNRSSMQENIGIIRSSNLCVSGDTKILTELGQIEIRTLEDVKVKVWNGEEFSKTTVRKTGVDQNMMEIKFSNGSVLKCTPYHKFYIQKVNPRHNPKNMHEDTRYVEKIEAKDLIPGMKLIKSEFPVLDSKRRFPYAYTHGAFCGDGTYERPRDAQRCGVKSEKGSAFCGRHRIHSEYFDYDPSKTCMAKLGNIPRLSLYGEKKSLVNRLEYKSVRAENLDQDRVDVLLHLDMPRKFKVPMNYSLRDKLDWFAGYCDMDGTIARNGTNESLQVGCIEFDFINDVKLMLQTMGCDPKVTQCKESGMRILPAGKGGTKKYFCQTCYRLLVNSNDLFHLHNLGFRTHRLLYTPRQPQRNAKQFVKVVSTQHLEEKMDTFCFTEKKRNMGMFNGVLTGQCNEISLHTSDKEIASCNLASLCLPRFVKDKKFDWESFIETVRLTIRVMENVIERNYYPDREVDMRKRNRVMIEETLRKNGILNPDIRHDMALEIVKNMESNEILPQIRKANLANRPLGIGLQGFGDMVARMDLVFDSDEATELNNRITQTMYYYAVDESANLARDLGPYDRFPGSPYSRGELHPDRWTAPSGKKVEYVEGLDWDGLREKVKGGVRHSTLLAFMPTASSSIIAGNSPSMEPINCIVGTKTLLSGQHVVLCKEAYNDLKKLGVWNERLVNEIVNGNDGKFGKENGIVGIGGIQHLEIPPEIKDNAIKRARFRYLQKKYRTGYELGAKVVIDHAAARTPFICQSQSTNLWISNPSPLKMMKMYNYGWKSGLKTIVYYVRGTSSLQARDISDPCAGGSCSA